MLSEGVLESFEYQKRVDSLHSVPSHLLIHQNHPYSLSASISTLMHRSIESCLAIHGQLRTQAFSAKVPTILRGHS
jgi:hypothetical protein